MHTATLKSRGWHASKAALGPAVRALRGPGLGGTGKGVAVLQRKRLGLRKYHSQTDIQVIGKKHASWDLCMGGGGVGKAQGPRPTPPTRNGDTHPVPKLCCHAPWHRAVWGRKCQGCTLPGASLRRMGRAIWWRREVWERSLSGLPCPGSCPLDSVSYLVWFVYFEIVSPG